MAKVYAKIKNRSAANKYRVFLDTPETLYKDKSEIVVEAVPYNPETIIDKKAWYFLESFSNTEYTIDVITNSLSSVDCESLSRVDYDTISYIFEMNSNSICFQNIGKSKLIRKKGILRIGNEYKYYDDYAAIPINDFPDAIYDKDDDKLYFQDISNISSIFPKITELYKEASTQETEDFLNMDFIVLGDGFDAQKVKTPNRKRIALVKDTVSKLKKKERKVLFEYINNYYPSIKDTDKTFKINSDDDLTMLLYGIGERFYTTKVGNEKRIANSVIRM